MMILATVAVAGDAASDFSTLKEYAKSLHNQPETSMQQFRPETTFEHYNPSPAQQGFYQGIEQEKSDLSGAAKEALTQDVGGKIVVEQFGKKQFEINPNNDAIKQAKLIEEESYALTHGISNERIHCDETPQPCELKNHEELCYTSRKLPDETCHQKRVVSVSSDVIHQRVDLTFWVARKWTGIITVNLMTGAMTNTVGGGVSNPIKLAHSCESMTTTIHSILNNGKRADWVGVVGLPSCANQATIIFNITKKWDRIYPIQVALTVDAKSQAFVSEEHWENGCNYLEAKSGLCQVKKEQCTDTASPKVINGLPVSRDCWEKELTYSCSSALVDECRTPKEKGCLQLSSQCDLMENNVCARYRQTYRCEEKSCPPNPVCLKNVFCRDGDCTEHVATQNEDFATSAAPLAVAGEAGREFSQTATLFAGHVAQCKIWSWDFIDCCSDKGWGKALNLAHCRDEDKALGQAKLNYLVHYLGKFCDKEVLGVCVEYKRSYCVFDSKMARIVQEARLDQHNSNGLGSPEHPLCSGLTVEVLQALDLGRVDFVNPIYPYGSGERNSDAGLAGDLKLNAPNASDVTQAIQNRIQQKLGDG